MPRPELWIGLVELRPLNRTAFGAAGAYTHILTWAFDPGSFRNKADEVAATLDMFVADVEWAESVVERDKRNGSPSEEIEDMRIRAESNPNAILFGTFYTYPHDEA
jgi:hypothetical protein